MAELHTQLHFDSMKQVAKDVHIPSPGYGHYASYHALWHLREIGVVSDLKTFESDAWNAAERCMGEGAARTRVALIDTSVAYEHPNLKEAVCKELMIDFFSVRLGTFPCPDHDNAPLDEALATAKAKAAQIKDERLGTLFEELCLHLPNEAHAARHQNWRTPRRVFPATNPAFSAHGTAMAGLIGARPLKPNEIGLVDTQHIDGSASQPSPPRSRGSSFPYAGVDPFCEIIPISTSFDPDPEQLLLAMLYAWLIDADIIVLARDFPDPLGSPVTGDPAPKLGEAPPADRAALLAAYPSELSQEELDDWRALRHLTLSLSQTVPIVCAAGNGGDETMILPAALAHPDNGVIAVGARAATKQRAGYSTAGRRKSGVSMISIYAPSGDGERLDRKVQRVDTADPSFRPKDHSSSYLGQLAVQQPALPVEAATKVSRSTFATQEIITTDVPGAAGYNSSAFARVATPGGAILDYRSYYCHFSGTSAAAALVAGMLSLAISAGKVDRRRASEAKARLRGGAALTDDDAATPALCWSHLA